MELRLAALTLKRALPLTDSKVAEIVTLLFVTCFPVARPLVVIETEEGADEFQVATPVTS